MVASTDSKHNQAELKSETTTDPLTMQCGAENIQNKTKDEITETSYMISTRLQKPNLQA
jgi:hypothetical protein